MFHGNGLVQLGRYELHQMNPAAKVECVVFWNAGQRVAHAGVRITNCAFIIHIGFLIHHDEQSVVSTGNLFLFAQSMTAV